jgi:hypothetical protein
MSVSDEPTLSGPLRADAARCNTKLERDPRTDPNPRNHSNKDQVIMARVRLCSWLVAYDPSQENDAARDYGIAYVQTKINTENRYCLGQANTKLRIPFSAKTYGQSPAKTVTTSKTRTKNVHLFLNASGHGSAATLDQSFLLHPDELKAIVRQRPKGQLFVSRFNGHVRPKRTSAFALGVKMSWLASEGTPSFLPRLNYDFIIPNGPTPQACG